MGVNELFEESAATALAHASELEHELQLQVAHSADPAVCKCREDAHKLVADIVSLRNAAELLKRQAQGGASTGT